VTATIDAVVARPVTVTAELLGPGPEPERVLSRLARRAGLGCLHGDWAGGGALVVCDPVLVVDGPHDPFAPLAVLPPVESGAEFDADANVVGGGWFGYVGYDGSARWAFHDHLLRYRTGQWWFESLRTPSRTAALSAQRELLAAALHDEVDVATFQLGPARLPSREQHLVAVERAIADIRAGDVYQVNICTRLTGEFHGHPLALFAASAARLRPGYGAYLAGADRVLVSMSPELFLRRRGRQLRTSPIKGTTARHADATADEASRQRLRDSAKDAAENVMIVDLMRNDLGRVSVTGSVRVPRLLDVVPHPGVWHLVSTVTAERRDDVDDATLLRAVFPPGSVTGAPKHRAVELIAEREAHARGAYTGVIGYLSPVAGLELNVAIRTFEVTGTRYELGVGGGITVDSVPVLEWRECLDKARPLLAAAGLEISELDDLTDAASPAPTAAQLGGGLLETVLVCSGRAVRLADHLARLDRSCRELYRAALPATLARQVVAGAATLADRPRAALRIVVSPQLDVTLHHAPLGPAPTGSDARIATRSSALWRHKWAERGELSAAESADVVPVFVDAGGGVLETSRGNLFVLSADGTLCTPALGDDVLPGVTRRAVLDRARDLGRPVRLGRVSLAELRAGASFWTSSLSGVVPLRSLDGAALPCDDAAIAALAPGPFVR
jgi:para-aminobenzoate synthetase/4-amino-4-deoxychorismate lyase